MVDEKALMTQACEIVMELIAGGEYPLGEEDMQGEAYLAVAEAMNQYGEYLTMDLAEEAIRDHMHKVRKELLAQQETDESLIRQVASLSQGIDKLTEELGDKPNLDELANEMGISQDRVIDILKLTGENVDGNA